MSISAVSRAISPLAAAPAPAVQAPAAVPSASTQLAPVDSTQLSALPKGIPAVAPLFAVKAAEVPLPPIEVVKRENYTYSRNAFGVQITQVDYEDGKYFFALSSKGLAVMLRQHDGKRDTLDFTDMNFNIPKPSMFPNVYFHVQGEPASRMFFNEQHQIVVELSNGEQLTLDRETGENVMSGPFSVRFNPDQMGESFDVIYSGADSTLKRYRSKGDTIQW